MKLKHIIGYLLSGAGTIVIFAGSLCAIYYCFKIVFMAAGFWGVVIGAALAPVLFFVAPVYAWFQWGDSSTFLIQYGSLFFGIVLTAIGGIFSDQEDDKEFETSENNSQKEQEPKSKFIIKPLRKAMALISGAGRRLKTLALYFRINKTSSPRFSLTTVIIVTVVVTITTNTIWNNRSRAYNFLSDLKQAFVWFADFRKPIISEVNISDISEHKAKIAWKTDELTKTNFYLGIDSDYSLWQESFDRLSYDHWLNVAPELNPGTTYHFKIVATDRRGNNAEYSNQTFITLGNKDILTATTSENEINSIKDESILNSISKTVDTKKLEVYLLPEEMDRIKEIINITIKFPGNPTNELHQEFWSLLEKRNKISEKEVEELRDFIAWAPVYMKYFYEDSLISIKTGIPYKSKIREEYQNRLSGLGLGAESRMKQNDELMKKIANKEPIEGGPPGITILTEDYIKEVLKTLEATGDRINKLFTR